MKISLQSIRTETLKMIVYLQLKYILKSYILCIDWTAGAMIATKSSDEHQLVHIARTMCLLDRAYVASYPCLIHFLWK